MGQAFIKTADSLRKYRSVPGLVYAVFTADKILEIQTSGTRKFKTKDSVRIADRFHIGTNTTIFTAYLAAKIAESGKIRWNTQLIKALPDLTGNSMKIYHTATLQQLLSQRAGIRPYTNMDDYKGIELLPGNIQNQRKSFAAIVLQQSPASVIDTSKPSFSVAGTALAAYMLERSTATDWEKLIDQYINKPLRISIGFGLPNRVDSLQPSGHWDRYGGLSVEPSNTWAKPIPAVAPASDINISLPHYIMFIQDLMKSLVKKKSFISPASANLLLFGYNDYSMGWEMENWHNQQIAWSTGRSALFSNYVEVIREKNIGIIVMCNTGSVNGRSVTRNFARILRDHYVQ
jgi:CubicO group peptidase (beta-lactamase class C family)